MKRITTLILAAGLFFSAMAPQAEAVEVQMNGKVIISGQNSQGLNFVNSTYRDKNLTADDIQDYGFNVRQRFQVGMKFVASEALSATLILRAPSNAIWGSSSAGMNVGGNIGVIAKQAYLDWIVPNTDIQVRMGKQNFAFPLSYNWSNSVMDDTATGITVTAPINDVVTIIGQWFRPESTLNETSSNVDVFALQVPLHFNNINVTPWAAYALGGRNTNLDLAPSLAMTDSYNAYWFGFSSTFNVFNPFEFGISGVYGAVDSSDSGLAKHEAKNNGWLADMYLAYNTSFGTPALVAWYGSGDSNYADNKRGGQLPQISAGYGFGNSMFFDNSKHGISPSADVITAAGTWGAGLKFTGFQPMEKTEMGAHVVYIQGTNSKYNTSAPFTPSYLTTKDSLVELGMYTTYDIYKELQVAFEANYIFQNFDKDIWAINQLNGEKFVNGWRAGLSFMYSF